MKMTKLAFAVGEAVLSMEFLAVYGRLGEYHLHWLDWHHATRERK